MDLRYSTIIKTLPDALQDVGDGSALYELLVRAATGYRSAVVAEEEARNRRDIRLSTFTETTSGKFGELVGTVRRVNGVLLGVALPTEPRDLGDFVRELVDHLYEGRRR